MNEAGIGLVEKERTSSIERIIGQYRGEAAGPTVICIGGMHGNEPSGVQALERIFERLEKEQPAFKGEFVGLTGNLRALREGCRYIDADLNRMWKLQPDFRSLAPPQAVYEAEEMQAVQTAIDQVVQRRRGPVIFIDLHTTSAPSPPFLLIGDTLRNRRFVKEFQLPIILGLEEQLNGPLLSYLNTQGHISMGFEAGQHEDPISVENHYSLVWLALARAGCLPANQANDLAANREWLSSQTDKELKGFFELRHRHGIAEGEAFVMKPGYRNFQPIQEGEVLAHNRLGEVAAKESGRIFMPLYQSQGDDGFFIVRYIRPFWLKVSAGLRKMGIHRILPYLPGIRRHPEHESSLIVDVRIVRWFGPQVLHLLGYRRRNRLQNKLHFIKRRYDLKGPDPMDHLNL